MSPSPAVSTSVFPAPPRLAPPSLSSCSEMGHEPHPPTGSPTGVTCRDLQLAYHEATRTVQRCISICDTFVTRLHFIVCVFHEMSDNPEGQHSGSTDTEQAALPHPLLTQPAGPMGQSALQPRNWPQFGPCSRATQLVRQLGPSWCVGSETPFHFSLLTRGQGSPGSRPLPHPPL